MSVVVTGSAGWVGSALVKHLRERHSKTVIGIDLALGDDLCDAKSLGHVLMQDIERVYHCAGVIRNRRDVDDTARYWRNNTVATATLLDVALPLDIEVVHVSTAAIDSFEAEDATPYQASKFAAELAILMACSRGLRATVARLHNPYGPNQPKDFVVPLFMQKILNEEPIEVGRNSRDYVFINDVARALCEAQVPPHAAGEPGFIEIGTGLPTTDAVLASEIMDVMGISVPLTFRAEKGTDQVATSPVDIDWTPLRRGLEKTWQWFKQSQ